MPHRPTHRMPRRALPAPTLITPHTQPSWVQQGDSIFNVACIGGAGGKGVSDRDEMNGHPQARIAAVCDVDEQSLNRAGECYPDASTHIDYRAMLSDLQGDINCVTISVPDHTHAHAALMVLDLGKHVYVQKPLTHSIEEVRLLQAKQPTTGLIGQMGN